MCRFCWGLLLLLSFGLAHAQVSAATPPAITGIAHVTFYANDFSRSSSFYAGLLGWEQVPAENAGAGVRFYANHLQYVELLSPPLASQADRLDSVAFQTSDVEVLRRYLGAHGVSVPDKVMIEKDGSRSFMVRDPEGNKVIFDEAGRHALPEPKNAAGRLSTHIMHAGYMVHDRAALDHFYRDILGFHLYWQGGAKEGGPIDWVMMQVPDGTDWIEYMLYLPNPPSREQLGSANHIAPGVVSVDELQHRLEKRGWIAPAGKNPQVLGVDGKLQLDLHDPDGTRVEFMEYLPVKTPCCSPYTGRQPTPSNGW